MVRQSSEFSKRRNRRRVLWFFGLLIGLSVIIFAIQWLIRLPMFAINSIQIVGADNDIMPILQMEVEKTLDENYLGIFDRRNILIYPRGAIAQALMATSTRIQDVIVRTDGLHQISINVAQRIPSAIVCSDLPDLDNISSLDSINGCFLADSSGFIFQQASASFPQAFDRYYVLDADIGSYVASSTRFSELEKAYSLVRSSGMDIRAILIKPDREYEMYVRSRTSSGPDITVIFFNESRPIADEISNLITFWSKNSQTGKKSSYESIDVRYGSNIFYR